MVLMQTRMTRRHASGGNILAMAMAFMFVLITIVIALHTSQSRAARTVTQAEAELQFRQAYEFTVAQLLKGGETLPAQLRVKAESALLGDNDMPVGYATKLWSGLPNWNPKDQPYAPGHRTYKLTPKTNDSALSVFEKNTAWMVAHDQGGYAAYAPNGSLTLKGAKGWANPNFTDERPVAEAYSGVPILLGAKKGIEVNEMPYGIAYSMEGPLDLGTSTSDLALGFISPLPLRAYEKELKETLNQARTKLEGAAASGNKTNDIKGGVLATVGGVLDMLTSGDASKLNVTLEQGMKFPFPMIPGFSATVPGVFFEFWFHMPYPPDYYTPGASDDGDGAKAGEKVQKLKNEIDALNNEIASLNAQIAATSDEDDRDELIDKRDARQDELDSKYDEMKVIQEQLEGISGSAKANILDNSSPQDVPATRAEDIDIPIPDSGLPGWNYGKLLSKMLDLLTSTITGDLKGIAESVTADVRLFHFGSKENKPEFKFSDGFFCDASFTVPQGRSFRYDGKMEISGDLWLQKGSVMQVTGDLKVSHPDPGSGSSNPLDPCGKIVMEEGATLIVGGDLKMGGDPKFGSLWVCSPPTHIAPVTSAIFTAGSTTIPYGSYSATNLEDMVRSIGGLDGLADAFRVLTTDLAPNLSKIAGPFHSRQPYFASYATTFQLTIVYTIVGPIPIPTPIPLPKKNILIPLFRALTMVYSSSLNMGLGENLYQHSDWWVFGDGVVPAMIKLNPLASLNGLKHLNLSALNPNIDWNDYLTQFATSVVKDAAKFAIVDVGKKLVTTVMASVLPGGSAISTVIEQVLDTVSSKISTFDNFGEVVTNAAITPILNELEGIKAKLDQEIEHSLQEAYLREVGGALIYADTITVGGLSDEPRLMAGMLVAEHNISVESKTFVGSLTSFQGNITAPEVYFTPLFTRASLYVPKATATNAFARAAQFEYGKAFDSKQAADITTGVWQVTTEGWSR